MLPERRIVHTGFQLANRELFQLTFPLQFTNIPPNKFVFVVNPKRKIIHWKKWVGDNNNNNILQQQNFIDWKYK